MGQARGHRRSGHRHTDRRIRPDDKLVPSVGISAAGTFHHYLWVGAERNVAGTTPVVPETWYNVVIAAQNNGPMRLYVNDREDGATVHPGDVWSFVAQA